MSSPIIIKLFAAKCTVSAPYDQYCDVANCNPPFRAKLLKEKGEEGCYGP